MHVSTTRAEQVPDGTEADCHGPHCGCAEQIQDRVGALRTGHLFLHGLLQHLCMKREFSQVKCVLCTIINTDRWCNDTFPYFNIDFFSLFMSPVKFGHTFKVLDGSLRVITQD